GAEAPSLRSPTSENGAEASSLRPSTFRVIDNGAGGRGAGDVAAFRAVDLNRGDSALDSTGRAGAVTAAETVGVTSSSLYQSDHHGAPLSDATATAFATVHREEYPGADEVVSRGAAVVGSGRPSQITSAEASPGGAGDVCGNWLKGHHSWTSIEIARGAVVVGAGVCFIVVPFAWGLFPALSG
ncbi:unnamed protein product, partial [Sphacelaria rigidula]